MTCFLQAADTSSPDYRMHYARGNNDESETVQLLFPDQSLSGADTDDT